MVKKLFIAICIGIACVTITAIAFQRWQKPHPYRETPVPAAPLKVTLIEGWTLDDIANKLSCTDKFKSTSDKPCNQIITDRRTFLTALQNVTVSDYPILKSKPTAVSLEGFIFPDTYFLTKNASSTPTTISNQLIKKALDNFSNKFTPAMEDEAKLQHLSVFEIVTLASIVEKETGRNAVTDEQKLALDVQRKIIAGIFYNRLKIGMPLNSDATINYVTHKDDPAVSANDLQTDSPYNTYRNNGLPPGPISNPSLSSLMAVLEPTKTDYFYFLHKQPSGDPVYSKTFEEHIANKQKYLK